MVVKDGKHKLVGFVNLGDMHEAFEKLAGNDQISYLNTYSILL